MTKIDTIKGVITLSDGSTSEFLLMPDGGWSQWGADVDRLRATCDALDVIGDALIEEDLLASDADPDPDEED